MIVSYGGRTYAVRTPGELLRLVLRLRFAALFARSV